jgi:hypothetical protein
LFRLGLGLLGQFGGQHTVHVIGFDLSRIHRAE